MAAVLLFAQAGFSQNEATSPVYRNSDPPGLNCGSFHARDIHGTVTDLTGDPVKDAWVQVYDDSSHKFLRKTLTDNAGRFSIRQLPRGRRYRVIFSSPGFLTEDWAVTIVDWPDGGLSHSKAIRVALVVHRGDGFSVCRSGYSR